MPGVFSPEAVLSGVLIPAPQLAAVAPGGADTPARATDAGAPPGTLQLLEQGVWRIGAPAQGGEAESQGQAGESLAEQIGQQLQGVRGWPRVRG